MGTAFSYSGNLFFSKSFIRLVGKNFLWKKCFLIRVIFLLVETVIEIWGKQFSKKELSFASGQLIISLVEISIFSDKDQLMLVEAFFFFNWNVSLRAYSCKWTTNFLVTIFSIHFWETLASDSIFSAKWKLVIRENCSFWLVETDLELITVSRRRKRSCK